MSRNRETQSATATVTAWPVLPPPYSSPEEEESETESDSDSDSDLVAVKPVVETHLKPVDDSNLRFILVKISHSADVVTRSTPTDANKSKTSERKSNIFQRIWSEDDEIVILKGMIDYLAKYKTDPTQDIEVFHSFIKEELQTDGTRTQLLDKITRMRNMFEKKIKNGKEVTFSKPHEQSVYDLSKTIWGNKEVNGGVVRRSDRNKKSGEVVEKKKKRKRVDLNYRGAINVLSMDGGDLFESEKEWKKLRIEELQNYLKQLEVRVVQTKLILAAMMKHS